MKNTKNKGKLRYMIYKSKDKYVGVCFELGIVEEEKGIDKLMYRLRNGAEAIVKAVIENKLDERYLNRRVGFKYYFMWYLGWIIKFKKDFNLKEMMPIEKIAVGENLMPSCI